MSARLFGLALTLLAPSAFASGPSFPPDFAPHPFETSVKLQNGDVSMTERFRGCGTSFTTDAPAWTFTLPQPMTDLRVWVDAPAVLVLPNDKYICMQGGVAYYNDWAKGTYKVFLFSSSVGLGAKIRVEMPLRARAEADAALAATPTLSIDPAAPDNPSYHVLTPGPAMRPELAGFGCGAPHVVALANLEVPIDGPWTVTARGRRQLHIVTGDGRCVGQSDNTRAFHLKAGRYAVWGQLSDRDPAVPADAPWELELAHDERPLSFSTPPTYELGALDQPLALPSTLTAPSFGPTRRVACAGVSRYPNYFVKVPTTGLGPISLEPLRSPGSKAPRMIVYGPLESMRPYQVWRCDESQRAVLNVPGTFAIFLASPEHDGQPVVTVARRLELKPDAMATPLPIPENPPLPERAVTWNYPFYGKSSLERFFLTAPDQLFVYLTAPHADAPAAEPLALIAFGSERSTVSRFDGTRIELPTASLTTTRPTPIILPKSPTKVAPAKDLDEALSLAGPAEKALVDAYDAAESKYRACVQRYMEKNDPSWGKSYELIYVASGKNVSDVWFRRADAACDYAGLEARGKRLTADINKSRQKSAIAYFKALQARFLK